jgi:hypothetical protein
LLAIGIKPSDQAIEAVWQSDEIENHSVTTRLALINSVDAAPPPRAVAVQVRVRTTDDDKDTEIFFEFLVHQPGVGPIGPSINVGSGDLWRDHPPDDRTILVPISSGRGFTKDERLKYAIRMQYHSTHGYPGWIGHVSAKVQFDDGSLLDCLGETGQVAMGDKGHGPTQYLRDFPFDQ